MGNYELEKVGFEAFGQADTGGGYDWAVFGVWLKDGVFYWASDSGCSCSCAWECSNFPDDFQGHGTAHDAIKALHSWVTGQYGTENSEDILVKLLDYRPEEPKG